MGECRWAGLAAEKVEPEMNGRGEGRALRNVEWLY